MLAISGRPTKSSSKMFNMQNLPITSVSMPRQKLGNPAEAASTYTGFVTKAICTSNTATKSAWHSDHKLFTIMVKHVAQTQK